MQTNSYIIANADELKKTLIKIFNASKEYDLDERNKIKEKFIKYRDNKKNSIFDIFNSKRYKECLNFTNEDLDEIDAINKVYCTIYATDMWEYTPWDSIFDNRRTLNELYAQLIDYNSKDILLSTEHNNAIRSKIIQLQKKGYEI